MSRGVPYDPVVTKSAYGQIAQPPVTKCMSVAIDPLSDLRGGDFTVVPPIPPTG